MNILILSHHFPPENAMASRRPYSWAKYWSKLGHTVCVLTTRKESFDAPLNLNLETSSFSVEEIPYVRTRKIKPIQTASANGVRLASKTNRFLWSFVLQSRKLRQAIGMGALLSVRSFWIRPAIKRAIELHRNRPFDVVVSTYGPPAPHVVASIIKQKYSSVLWVADYRDLWNDYNTETRRWPFSTLENYIENHFVSSSDLLTTVSKHLANILKNRFERDVVTIENGFDSDAVETGKRDFFPSDGKVRLVYTGRLHSKNRNPLPLLRAVKQVVEEGIASESNLEVLFYSNEIGGLSRLASEMSLEHIVKMPGFVDRVSSLSAQRSADALIFIDWSDPTIDGILTGKIFEYLYAGKPILGVGSDESRAAGRLIHASGTGYCLGNSSDAIATIIRKLLNGEALAYTPNRKVIAKYSREALANQFLNEISDRLKSRNSL